MKKNRKDKKARIEKTINDKLVLIVCENVSTVTEDTYSVSEMHNEDSV